MSWRVKAPKNRKVSLFHLDSILQIPHLFPAVIFIAGIGVTALATQFVKQNERHGLESRSLQRSTAVVERLKLQLVNSILRIQSYDELFELSSAKLNTTLTTLQSAMRSTVFKHLAVYRVDSNSKRPGEELVLKKLRQVDTNTSNLPTDGRVFDMPPDHPIIQTVAFLINTRLPYQTVIHELGNNTILSVVWHSSDSKEIFLVFSTTLTAFVDAVELSPLDKIQIEDPTTRSRWTVQVAADNKTKTLTRTRTGSFSEQSAIEARQNSNVDPVAQLGLQFESSPLESSFSVHSLTAAFGVLLTLMATYLFWILLSQNRRISGLVVQKTVDLEEANANLHEALLAKTKFVGNVSHEIRTPLNLILGMLDLFEQDRLDQKHRKYIESMKTAGLHLLGMVEDLLDFSKADYQNLDLRIVSVNLIKLVEEVAAIAGPLARNRNLICHFVIDPRLPANIDTDPRRLKQILLNLLRNASKYTESGFVLLRISVFPSPDIPNKQTIRFEVQDSGIGIPRDRIGHIFDAFFQIESARLLSAGGVGLGLSIVKDLVHKLDGRISVRSIEGQGSTFTIDFDQKSIDGSLWTQNLSQVKDGIQKVMLVSSDRIVRETFGFLDFVKGIKLEVVNPAGFRTLNSDLNDKIVVIDSREPSFSDIATKISTLKPRRVILFGGTPNPFRDTSFSVTILDAFPLLPTSILRSIGLEGVPLRPSRAETPAPDAPSPSFSSDARLKIIVADDDAGNRELYRAYLENDALDIRFATNGQEALELQKAHPADTIIADLRMPVMDGFALIEGLRQHESANHLPAVKIILVTADAHEETAKKALSYRNTQYLTKPIRKAQLMQAIQRSIS